MHFYHAGECFFKQYKNIGMDKNERYGEKMKFTNEELNAAKSREKAVQDREIFDEIERLKQKYPHVAGD